MKHTKEAKKKKAIISQLHFSLKVDQTRKTFYNCITLSITKIVLSMYLLYEARRVCTVENM